MVAWLSVSEDTTRRSSGFRRHNAFWRRFADVRKRTPSRKKRYPILFRNHPGIPDFVNFPFLLPCRPQYRNLHTSISRGFFISSSTPFEDRLQRPSSFVPPVYLAVNACGGWERQARSRHDLGFWVACSSFSLNLDRGSGSAQTQRGNFSK